MAKAMVTLAFIYAIVFSVFSLTIAEIVEKGNLNPLPDGEIVLATYEVEQAAPRRFGPWIRQPILSIRDPPGYCISENDGISCANCNEYCTFPRGSGGYGQCEWRIWTRVCTCHYRCVRA
ncbi:hypothetical protein CARUB_v10016126mg [Capsella rubella]|uniref:Defensin-like protein n=1 Tax=Capsella rubella TaxID=81985 RepID=R0I496_9BRAS|nr:uncharacterized protein LOC17892843 [Capsella rubella]EOA32815.1 hypothetical protein CARUB_v10016126mg [Capsella rubella]